MLLALQGQEEHPRMQAAARYLRKHAETTDDLEHLCWIKLALDVFGDQAAVGSLDQQIVDAYRSRGELGWLPPSPYRNALAALSLATASCNYFRLPARASRSG